MDTLRKLLAIIIEEEVKHQQALKALRDLQAKYDALKAEKDATPQPKEDATA